MAIGTVLREGFRIGQAIWKTQRTFDRKVFFANPTNRFIRRFVPPGYRKKAYRFARYAEISAAAGYIYDSIQQDQSAQIPKQAKRATSRKQYKKYSTRRTSGYSRFNRSFRDECRRRFSRNRNY